MLALCLARKPRRRKSPDIDISGTLQAAWLLDSPYFRHLDRPDLDKLRKAGMFILDPDEILHSRTHRHRDCMSDDTISLEFLHGDDQSLLD